VLVFFWLIQVILFKWSYNSLLYSKAFYCVSKLAKLMFIEFQQNDAVQFS